MLNVLGFYNYFGNGDLFNSREIIKEIMKNVPAKEYYYLHSKSPRMFQDIRDLKYSPINYLCRPNRHFYQENNETYINTWIGLDSKYVLPGIGCVLEMNIKMYNMILERIGESFRLEKDVIEYLPSIRYGKLPEKHIINIRRFLIGKDKVVLISNGDVQSNQAKNFDFTPAIEKLALNFPEISFAVTAKIPKLISIPNIYFTGDIIQSEDGFDLNEISFLSKFCKVIIGRSSGPYVFTQVKENFLNPDKVFLSFTYHSNAMKFLLAEVPAKRIWSGNTETDLVYRDMEAAIKDV